MIQANELRIGNCVLDNHTIRRVNAIDGSYYVRLNRIEEPFVLHIQYIEPVPLSSELLEKAGFHRQVIFGNESYINKDFEVCMSTFGATEAFTIAHNIGAFYPRLDYLHQLQNLYFALTGQELEIVL